MAKRASKSTTSNSINGETTNTTPKRIPLSQNSLRKSRDEEEGEKEARSSSSKRSKSSLKKKKVDPNKPKKPPTAFFFFCEVVHLKSQEVQEPVACGSGSGVSTLPEGFTLNPTGVVCEAGWDGRHGCSGNFDGELGCGFESFAGKKISGGRIGDFGDGFSGGGTGGVNSEFGGEAHAVWVDFSTVQRAEVEVFVGNGIGGFFEKGGANSSGSGGGSGALTGKVESDGETAASGGLNRDGADFVKGGSITSSLQELGEDFRRGYQDENPEVKSMRDIGKACGEKWKIMTYEEKVKYYDIATEKRAKFDKAMAEYIRRKESGEGAESENSESDFNLE
uniref:HMG box domain-containing protein n=1 Tax=Chenopodium quinoa TaxID=63459 RepID=A0A803MDR0_CHEQI